MNRIARIPVALALALALALAAAAGCAGNDHHSASNRDRHGPEDVAGYIQRLTGLERVERLQVDFVLDSVALKPDQAVADIGCGPGVFAIPLAKRVPQGVVYAIDVEPAQLDALRTRSMEQGLENVIPVLAGFSRPHIPPASVDLVFLADTYHHIEDRAEYFKVVRSRLRSGGRLAILEWKPGDLPFGPPPEHKLSRETREQELGSAGFVLEKRFDRHELHDFEIWQPVD